MNEVDSGLMIVDTLQGVPVDISASLIMNLVCPQRPSHRLNSDSYTAFRI